MKTYTITIDDVKCEKEFEHLSAALSHVNNSYRGAEKITIETKPIVYEIGTELTDRITRSVFFVMGSDEEMTSYVGYTGNDSVGTERLANFFDIAPPQKGAVPHGLDYNEGGVHYGWQPWSALRVHLTAEEFAGYVKGLSIKGTSNVNA